MIFSKIIEKTIEKQWFLPKTLKNHRSAQKNPKKSKKIQKIPGTLQKNPKIKGFSNGPSPPPTPFPVSTHEEKGKTLKKQWEINNFTEKHEKNNRKSMILSKNIEKTMGKQ